MAYEFLSALGRDVGDHFEGQQPDMEGRPGWYMPLHRLVLFDVPVLFRGDGEICKTGELPTHDQRTR